MPKLVRWLLLLWSLLIAIQAGEAANPGPPNAPDPAGFDDGACDFMALVRQADDDGEITLEAPEDGLDRSTDYCMDMEAGEPFIAATEFAGARVGYVFKMSSLGLGYYIDYGDDNFVAADEFKKEVWPSYLHQVGRWSWSVDGTCRGTESMAWTLSLWDLLFADNLKRNVGQKRTHRKRPKRPRKSGRSGHGIDFQVPEFVSAEDDVHSHQGLWAVDTVNPNCAKGVQKYLGKSMADFVMVQELKAHGLAACQAEERAARREGWGLVTESAVLTDKGGVSAGVGVAARLHFGMTKHTIDLDASCCKGRIAATHVGAVCRGGIHVLSAYLWCSEGLTPRNLDLLQSIAQVIAKLFGPWCLAADWNLNPEALRASGWLDLVQGCIVVPGGPTCGKETYDYFVVSKGLRPAVLGAAVVDDGGFHPHSPTRLFLKGKPRKEVTRVLVAPRKFPAETPAGCLQDPRESASLCAKVGNDIDSVAELAFVLAEKELVSMHGIEEDEAARYGGRSHGPRFVLKPALGLPGSHMPRCSRVTAAWDTIASWFKLLVIHWSCLGLQSGAGRTADNARRLILHTSWEQLGHGRHAVALQTWTSSLSPSLLLDKTWVIAVMRAVSQVAEQAHAHDSHLSQSRWTLWLNEGPASGLGRQHKMSRTATGWIPCKVGQTSQVEDDEGGLVDDVDGVQDDSLQSGCFSEVTPLDRQQAVDTEAGAWAKVWQQGVMGNHPVWPSDMGAMMPELVLDQLRAACHTFPGAVGLGWDKMHPRSLARCSDMVLKLFVRLMLLAETLGSWPKCVGVIMVVLLPKPDGGRRPIGLFPTIVRVWMRIRLEVAQAWMVANDRAYFYAGPAKGADVAAWKQSLLAEAAHSMQLPYVSTLLDLVKAFDTVPFDWMAKQASKFRYNLWLLRLSLAAYLLARVLDIDGCCSVLVWASRGLAAGSVLATIELRVLLIEFADMATSMSLYCRITLYVDDATVETVCTSRGIRKEHARVTNAFTEALIQIRLLFSDTKNVTCASSSSLAKDVCALLMGIQVKVAARVISLGSGTGAGVRRNASKMRSRLKDFRARVPRFKALRRSGVKTDRLLRTGGIAAPTFGQRALGVADSMLLGQRRAAAAATCDKACGADLDLTLVIADGRTIGSTDPAFEAHIGVVHMWALAVWENWAPRAMLARLVDKTLVRLNRAKRVWAVVYGPAAALVATLRRLGWGIKSAFVFESDDGKLLDLRLDSPAYIKGVVCDSVERWRWRRVEGNLPCLSSGGKGRGAWWKPIARALRQPDSADWNAKHKGALKSTIMNRQWTQQRLHAAGLVESPVCQLCKDLPGGGQVGTLLHRLYCPALRTFRSQHMPVWVKGYMEQSGGELPDLVRCCLTRGLYSAPEVPERPQDKFDTFNWHTKPETMPIGCRVFTDGSLLDGKLGKEFVSLGWAFVVIDDVGSLVAAAYGVPPVWVDSIQGAELWAVQMTLSSVVFPSAIYTDCKTVQLGVRKEAQWVGSSKRRYARMWLVIHSGLDNGGASESVVWMPAHTSADRIGEAKCSDGSTLTEHMWYANQLVDLLAKQAAESVRHERHLLDWTQERYRQLVEVAMFVGKLTYEAGAHVLPDGKVARDSEGLSTRIPLARRRRANGHARGDPSHGVASQAGQLAMTRDGPAPQPAPSCKKYPKRAKPQPGSGRVAPAAAKGRAKQRAANNEAERQKEAAFQLWWREHRAQRVSPAAASSASGRDRLAAVRLRCLGRGAQ